MKKAAALGLLVVLLFAFASCAAGPNDMEKTADSDGETAGFWKGLWQGIIAPVTFIISLFSDKVSLYEVHNNGGWYNFGFVLGLMMIFGGGGGGAGRARRKG